MEKNKLTPEQAKAVAESIIEAYAHVVSAPDASLDPITAWTVGAAYTAEFTMRQLFKNGLIDRKSASPVFTATGGDLNDIEGWER